MRIVTAFVTLFSLIASTAVYGTTFEISNLADTRKTQLKELKIWHDACPVSLDRLKLINFSYYDFNGNEQHDGELVILDAAAKRALHIFKELHALKFPIAKAHPMEHYKGNDEDSMADNNTSCYNCREITGGGGLPSIHAYGLAIDVNPVQNPFISFEEKGVCATKILPALAKDYINRTNLRPGMAEKIVELFKNNGFTIWGGKWNTPIDWQHFQPPRTLAQLLATMSSVDSEEFFDLYADSKGKLFESIKSSDNKLLELYKKSPDKFMQTFRHNKSLFDSEPDQAFNLIEHNS